MQQSIAIAAVAVGGGIGSVLRYAVSNWFIARVGSSFPWGTFAINVSGAFAIGIVLQLVVMRAEMSPYVRLFFATGVLGGYTTFSSYAFEILTLGTAGLPLAALAYALGSLIAGLVAAYAGTLAVRAFAA